RTGGVPWRACIGSTVSPGACGRSSSNWARNKMTDPAFMDIAGILRRLPHRYPFLLVDRVLACEPGKSIRAVKNVTCNEPQFTGHFPDRPVMPGVLIIEA